MSQSPKHHQARKRFGQNFLVDEGVITRIVQAISPKTEDNLVEIGPGQGAITAHLLEGCASLQAIELDRDLVPRLRTQFFNYPKFVIHQADALKFDFAELAKNQPLRVVGNLPYNISTPLIFHLLESRQHISDMHFMLQKEVVERMAAIPGDEAYGRLSIMCQYYCAVEMLFEVPPEAFRPIPKVDSAIVKLRPHAELPCVAEDEALFANIVKTVFQMRRKTLRNGLKAILDKPILEQLGEQLNLRPEALSLQDFVNLSNRINQLKHAHV